MDELVIEDKKYLSSKKAAKLTGYAKDYVGQLCREGKVEARLVGRNWYVLESSIMDHRFGTVADVTEEGKSAASLPTSDASNDSNNGLEYKWSSPVYTTESYSSLPTEVVPPRTESIETPPLKEVKTDNPQALNDMQSAWQEWFEKQKAAEKMLPDASEMMLLEAEESLPEEKPEETVSITRDNSLRAEEYVPDTSYTEESAEEIAIPIRHVASSYPVQEEREESVVISRKREEVYVRPEYRSDPVSRAVLRAEKKAAVSPKERKSTFLLKVTILSIAAIFMAVTYLAFSSKDTAESGEANTLINFLTGVSTVESQK